MSILMSHSTMQSKVASVILHYTTLYALLYPALPCSTLPFPALLHTKIFYCILSCYIEQKYGQELTCKCLTHLILISIPCSHLIFMSIYPQTSLETKISELKDLKLVNSTLMLCSESVVSLHNY